MTMKNTSSKNQQLNRYGRPTILEYLAGFQLEAAKECGLEMGPLPSVRPCAVPEWGKKIFGQLRKTVFRTLIKLRPGTGFNCQQFGKLVGIGNRHIKFLQADIWRIIEEDGWDKISDDDWERIQPRAQLCAYLASVLNRTVGENESDEDLACEVIDQTIKRLENLRTSAFQFISARSARDQRLFYKGLAQGYSLFMDDESQFCGDRGRTEIYMELLSSQYEIEKMRRMIPPKKDEDLYAHLERWYKFPNSREYGSAWLRDVCDDISLYMTGKCGRPKARET
jgi:hypothetical protein